MPDYAFYVSFSIGLYYHFSKRGAGIHYVFIGKPMNQRPRYLFLYLFTLSKRLTTWTHIETNHRAIGTMSPQYYATNESENVNDKEFIMVSSVLDYLHTIFLWGLKFSRWSSLIHYICRYQILGIFLLIQLCILGAERLRRSNLSSIASSINQISSGSYPSSTGTLLLNLFKWLFLRNQ